MLGYIYILTNKVNGKKYVGQTLNLDKRLYDHFWELKRGQHHSIKLQRAYDKYGYDAFEVTSQIYEINDIKELYQKEIETIAKYDSFNNGYNMTIGGEGNKTRFDEHDSVLLYQILQRYDGIQRTLSRYYDCDPSVFAAIAQNTLYSSIQFNEQELQNLIQKLQLSNDNLKENYKPHNLRKLNQQAINEILAVNEFNTNYRKTCAEFYGVNPTCINRLVTGQTYLPERAIYFAMPEAQRKQLSENTIKTYQLDQLKAKRQRNCVRNPLTQEQVNYILSQADAITQKQIAENLGISKDRVSSVIRGISYQDLIDNYYTAVNKSRNEAGRLSSKE